MGKNINVNMDLHHQMMWECKIKKGKLEHDYTMAGFAVSVSPAVWEQFEKDGASNGKVCGSLERVVWKLHKSPNPNAETLEMLEDAIVDMFWTKFEDSKALACF